MAKEFSRDDLDKLRHSTAHLLAAAVLELWPDAKPTIGPAIEDGFYYDFEFTEPISEDNLKAIGKKMRELLPAWTEFSHQEVTADEAKQHFVDNPYKAELIDEIVERGDPISLYTSGEFTDLCRGNHVEEPVKQLGHFKLLSIAGAYWRGDENNAMLTRIYGTAWPTKESLKEHLRLLEEAKKRDHRKLGRDLDLFTFSPLVGSGLPLFTPRGTIIREELERWLRSIQEPLGYQRVDIPHIAKPELYKVSGHWDKFEDNLFHVRGKGGEPFVMKPMNCPHHTQIYASKPRSYRDLPLRFSEITKVYRDEQAGELQGLSRVRSISQDDAHIFCRQDQIKEIVMEVMEIVTAFYAAFDFELSVHLSIRDPEDVAKYLGDDAVWQEAETQLQAALDANGVSCVVDTGEAAFYGPKIDFVARDSLKREWQLATIQLDFNMPQRFELEYIDEHGERQTPVMIHRAIMGALERFMAILLEHYAGALPLWLSPTQVAVLPISDDQLEYAKSVAQELRGAGMRVEVDTRGESIGKKIREAEVQKVPVMLVVGKKEVAAKTVAVRSRSKGDEGTKSVADVTKDLTTALAEHRP